jgi:Stage II sporulation protein E (SpoIIE)
VTFIDFALALRQGLTANPAAAADVIASVAASIGGTDVIVYLVDFEQKVLEPLPNFEVHVDLPEQEEVDTTMAGRAFLDQRAVVAERSGGTRVWVPVLEGSDRSGVLALTVTKADDEVLRACEDLGLLTGYLIATHSRSTDIYGIHRRRKAMSLAASLQWDLLPPLVLRTTGVTVAGRLEPAYDVGGDCFDYSINGPTLDIALFDAMGHGIMSSATCALAVGCYRHDRREGRLLPDIHANLDTTIAQRHNGQSFVTGQLARLDVESGTLTWTNAGHPLPLLIRGGHVVGEIRCNPTVPWGLGAGPPSIGTEALEPGDRVMFYTDGVVEARRVGAQGFGIERLVDLIGQHASDQLRPEDIIRHIVRAVLEHHEQRLDDDATVVIVDWHRSGPQPLRASASTLS